MNSPALRWNILLFANALDEQQGRQRIMRERRRARRERRTTSNPFQEMDDVEFAKTYRLNKSCVRELIALLTPLIPEERRRDGISLTLKILIALSFYASGSYQTLVGQSAYHNVSQTVVSRAVRQVTEALNSNLIYNRYIKWPSQCEERNLIKSKFYQKFAIPGVLGCIDGTHIAILKPSSHEERFLNRKGFHSLNVMIICDADLRILALDASTPGAAHDSFVWSSHPLSAHLNELDQNGEHLFLLGDTGYALRRTMITPILNTEEGSPEHYFYLKHVAARNTVERCIGVLKSRFRCLLMARTLHYSPIMAGKIINACAVLHNLAIAQNAPLPRLTQEEAQDEQNHQVENLTPPEEEDIPRPSARRINPDLDEGRQRQRHLVQRLWAERAEH